MTIRKFTHPVVAGAVAGAAGVTALNAVTYLDMLARGRSASETPSRMAQKMLDLAGVQLPGDDETRHNRLEALGALLGIATGVGVGVLHRVSGAGTRLPAGVASLLAGAVAMAAADLPMAAAGVTQPRTWSTTDWLSDAIPHAVYGAVTTAAIREARH